MGPFTVPRELARGIAAAGSPSRTEWLARLPHSVRALAERWALTVGAPFQPGGSCSWVAPARDARGRELVLKVGWRHPESEHEADGLRAWRGQGAVEVFATHVDGPTAALLLERCAPGTPLAELRREPEQDEIVAGRLRRLRFAPPVGHPFRPLTELCDLWADDFEQKDRPDGLDPGIARAGMEHLRSLARDPSPQYLLVTDLHAGNILAAHREPWLVIDPKPYVGDPCYDVLQHLLNCPERLTADPCGLARRMADLTGLDAERVTTWLFARAVQESAVQEWLRPIATALAPR